MTGTERPALPVSRVLPAYQQVADQLRSLILSGELRAGDRLPSETELVTQFGVSRSTVREALRALTSRDLVHTRRGVTGGTFVSAVDARQVSAYLETSLGLMSGRDGLGVHDMLEAREILEVPSARLAAERRSEAHLEGLRQALRREVATEGRQGRFVEHRTFHQIVVDAAQNPLLSMMTEPLFRVLEAQFLRPEGIEGYYARVDEEHTAIFAAVEQGDADAAASLMATHLRWLREVYEV
ncbi:FadR/GntR family transcriptional regulator [Nocardioides gansuensis]|uniref:FadR/GntR family transcriptional regulator n=1 Tax=Nocardioides gansuensis TaxID=2138300 RepID=UPI001402DB1C|nr:FadR/GntR family transcriptional regulator [Nocardioides gansuensis]